MKKRTGKHERTIREYHIDAGGVRIGPPLETFMAFSLASRPMMVRVGA